ncbi:MAG: hypothetical protein ACOVKJ_02635, partial [Flavobacterium sp.]
IFGYGRSHPLDGIRWTGFLSAGRLPAIRWTASAGRSQSSAGRHPLVGFPIRWTVASHPLDGIRWTVGSIRWTASTGRVSYPLVAIQRILFQFNVQKF